MSPAALFLPLRDTPHGPGSGWPEGPDGAIVASPCWAIDVCGSHALIFGTGDHSNRATSDMHGTRKEHGSNGWPSATPRLVMYGCQEGLSINRGGGVRPDFCVFAVRDPRPDPVARVRVVTMASKSKRSRCSAVTSGCRRPGSAGTALQAHACKRNIDSK